MMKANCLSMIYCFLASLAVSGAVMAGLSSLLGLHFFLVWELIFLGAPNFEIPLLFDKNSGIFCFSVSLIAFCVMKFSESYMVYEKNFVRFHLLVFLFVLSMMLLIFSPSLVSLFLGWDGLGVSSYFLVVYFDTSKSFNAGLLTALSNRVGDVLFLLSLGLFSGVSSWNFFLWSGSFVSISSSFYMVICLACFTKSAQIPFSAWLPAAMAAPTPVSALVHSSTLVTAGVYTLFRFMPFLSKPYWFLIFFTGSITMFMAGCAALKESDAKKVVALSTLSQLGIMMMTLGAGSASAGFFHLVSHAFFKALMFMVVGNFIHLSLNYQDLRKMGINSNLSSESVALGSVANFSLMGLPFLSGYYSKDYCIEWSFTTDSNFLGEVVFVGGICLTVVYSLRFLDLSGSSFNMSAAMWNQEKSYKILSFPLMMMPMSVLGSSMISWLMFHSSSLFIPGVCVKLIMAILVLSVFWKKVWANFDPKTSVSLGSVYMWNLGFLSSYIFSSQGLKMGKLNYKTVESSWFCTFYFSSVNYTSVSALMSASYFSLINFSLIFSCGLLVFLVYMYL